MARSSYIYVVTDGAEDAAGPRAAFTVKHELVSWIERQPPAIPRTLRFWRLPDNPGDPSLAERLGMNPNLPRELELDDLLGGKQIR